MTNSNLSPADLAKLEKITAEDNRFTVPVSWTAVSTVIVEANNLKEALEKATAKIDELPLPSEPEYRDDSYQIDVSCAEDAINAQCYISRGDILIKANGKIERF